MTEQEAEIKRTIDYIRLCRNAGIDTTITINKSRSHLILNALEEIQMYQEGKLCLIPNTVFRRQCEELDEYKELGTVEELERMKQQIKSRREFYQAGYEDGLREAREKQVPKKVIKNNGISQCCPNCGYPANGWFCSNCGQAIRLE